MNSILLTLVLRERRKSALQGQAPLTTAALQIVRSANMNLYLILGYCSFHSSAKQSMTSNAVYLTFWSHRCKKHIEDWAAPSISSFKAKFIWYMCWLESCSYLCNGESWLKSQSLLPYFIVYTSYSTSCAASPTCVEHEKTVRQISNEIEI